MRNSAPHLKVEQRAIASIAGSPLGRARMLAFDELHARAQRYGYGKAEGHGVPTGSRTTLSDGC